MHARLPNFDWLRLLLACEVLLIHLNGKSVMLPIPFPVSPVPAFLTISGYLVLQSWERSRNVWHFWRKRLLRITPALLASLVLTGALLGGPAIVATVQYYFTLGLSEGTNVSNRPVWSLGWEEVLYACILPLTALGAYRKPLILWGLLLASFVLWFAYWGQGTTMGKAAQLPTAFLLGNLAYVYKDALRPFAAKWGYLSLSAGIILQVVDRIGVGVPRPGIPAALPEHPLIWLLIMSSVLLVGMARNSTKRAPADFSYSVYIYHWPVMMFTCVVLQITSWVAVPIVIMGTAILAAGSWYFIESPALRFKDRRLAPKLIPADAVA